jgi:lantibiotic biosynthesis protein
VAESWEPILVGKTADRARGAVLDIARVLAGGNCDPPRPEDAALFWAYLAGAFDDDWIAAKYDEAVGALADHALRGFADLSLYQGAAGTGFAIAHISEPGTVEASLEPIDTLIFDAIAAQPPAHYDLISGLVGIGVYLVERGDAPTARRALDRLIDHLLARGEQTADGIAWFTSPELLPHHQLAQFPHGAFNCGVAHGIPGVVALLARVAGLPGTSERARDAAVATLGWLAARRLDGGGYPAWVTRGNASRGELTRTAWCYGDAGVALATWSATSRLGLATTDAVALARACARRPPDRCGVVDAGLCHGAAGLAHIYNRFYQASREPEFRTAATAWFEAALAMRRPDGLAGFLACESADDGVLAWQPMTSMLMGVIGIGLALLAAIEPTAPGWDRTMLCEL